jgi:DMSO/TMAO reductase YedYZ molybdopterin-dependent catalytic subunit
VLLLGIEMADGDVITSPDTTRQNRLPPGQHLVKDWPVLHFGSVHHIKPAGWRLHIFGMVNNEKTISFDEFEKLPKVKVFSDIHCVTTWSRLNNLWSGVSSAAIVEMAGLQEGAGYVIAHGSGGFTTNLALADFLQDDVLLASFHDGQIISPEHGGPVRLVVPRLYFWKSAKWLTGLEFSAEDMPGFWERAGYHNHGDPWKEERYGRSRF